MGATPLAPSFARQDVPPSNYFQRVDGVLTCDGVDLRVLASQVDTPTYVYAARAIDDAFEAVREAMTHATDRDVLVAYAIKANGNLAILKRLAARGCGADIVSGGELARALKAGVAAENIVFSGVGKRTDEIEFALESEIRAIHVESAPEISAVEAAAKRRGKPARIALRVNPDVDAETHPYIATGLHDTKFGLELDVARELLPTIVASPHLHLEGVACHIGSQLGTTAPLREAVGILGRFGKECRAAGASRMRSLDVGGGWPMEYGCEAAAFPSYVEFGQAIRDGLADADAKDFDLITEPGRALVGGAGALLTRVVFVKTQADKRFVVVDGAMTELIRPALYEAYHAVVPVIVRDGETTSADVVGPVCESGDFLALDRKLPPVEAGDAIALMGAGAYGREMAMTYNARPPAAEVLVENGEWRVVRKRASVESLWALEDF